MHGSTPLDYLQVEDTLCKYGIFNDWCRIVYGICDIFNVGIPVPPETTAKIHLVFALTFYNQQNIYL